MNEPRYFVIRKRDDSPVEVFMYLEEPEAETSFETLSENCSKTYLCRVLKPIRKEPNNFSIVCPHCGSKKISDQVPYVDLCCLTCGKGFYKDGGPIETESSEEDQYSGGFFLLPNGYYVNKVVLDADPPFCIVAPKDTYTGDKDKTILIPKALAYYLTTHHNGSVKFRSRIIKDARNELRNQLRSLLEKE